MGLCWTHPVLPWLVLILTSCRSHHKFIEAFPGLGYFILRKPAFWCRYKDTLNLPPRLGPNSAVFDEYISWLVVGPFPCFTEDAAFASLYFVPFVDGGGGFQEQ